MIRPALLTNALAAVRTLIQAGSGVGFLWELVGDSLALEGKVERVLPQWELPPAPLSLIWPLTRLMSPRLRAFLDFVSGTFLADPSRG